jgi:hypothetical protein
MFRPVLVGLALVVGPAVTAAPSLAEAAPRPVVVKDVSIPPLPLKDLQRSIADDRGVKLGGIGSGLFPAEQRGDYWMVTDRGPNGQVGADKRRTFPIPEFGPAINKSLSRHAGRSHPNP